MQKYKDVKRRIKEHAMQKLGVVEATEDGEFSAEYTNFKSTCMSLQKLKKKMEVHLDAIRRMQDTGNDLTLELAAFHQNTDAATCTVALAQTMFSLQKKEFASVEKLFTDEVVDATQLLLWRIPDVDEKIHDRRNNLLDYDAHLRKYEHIFKLNTEGDDLANKRKTLFKPLFSKSSRGDADIAEELNIRKLKLDTSEQAVDDTTNWLLEHFEELEMKRQHGTLLEGPLSAFVACHMHLHRNGLDQLDNLKMLFESASIFGDRLNKLDSELQTIEAAKTDTVDTNIACSTPQIVCDCIAYIKSCGMTTEGIFRIPGNCARTDKLIQDSKIDFLVDGELTVHDVCTVLKGWFRKLPSPIIPEWRYEDLISIVRDDVKLEDAITISNLISFVKTLPATNAELLGLLSEFLSSVSEFQQVNRMSARNLATCFAPSLIRAPLSLPPNRMMEDIQAGISAVEVFILHASKLPTPSPEMVFQSTSFIPVSAA